MPDIDGDPLTVYKHPPFALALAASKDGEWSFSGTGVILSDGLAMTAAHVIDGYVESLLPDMAQAIAMEKQRLRQLDYALGPKTEEEIPRSGTVERRQLDIVLLGFQVVEPHAAWRVSRAYGAPGPDICFLRLEPYNEAAASQGVASAAMDLCAPMVGAVVNGFGVRNQEIVGKNRLKCDPHTVTGTVLAVHNAGLPGRTDFPCFLTDATVEPGMSGGPFFNSSGELCGIASSGWEGDASESRISCLWPSMNAMVDFPLPTKVGEDPYPIIDLIEPGYLKARNAEKVNILETGVSLRI